MMRRSKWRRPVAERNALVEANLPLAAWVVERYCRRFIASGLMEYEDAHQTARVGLINAAETWREGRGVKFSTYATLAIMRRVEYHALHDRLVRHAKGGRLPVIRQLEDVLTDDDGNSRGDSLVVLGTHDRQEATDNRLDAAEAVRAMQSWNWRDREALLRWAQGWTLWRIGRWLRVSRQAAEQLLGRIRERLRLAREAAERLGAL